MGRSRDHALLLQVGNLLRAAANEHKAKMVANDYDPTAKIASTNTTSGSHSAQPKSTAPAPTR